MARLWGSRVPTTSYGYSPPRDAQVEGWTCPGAGCGRSSDGVVRRLPRSCPACGGRVDATFSGRWGHDAEGYLLRHLRRSGSPSDRARADAWLPRWEYEDAVASGDPSRIDAARRAFHEALRRWGGTSSYWMVTACQRVVPAAARADDPDFAAEVLLAWHPGIETRDVDDDNEQRTAARTFVATCAEFLADPVSIGHPQEKRLLRAMEDVRRRAETVMFPALEELVHGALHRRATTAELGRFAALIGPSGPGGRPRTAEAWRAAVRNAAGSPITVRARLATERVAWALTTDDVALVAEAYGHLMPLIPPVVAARHGEGDDDEFLRAAQEHTEEAGYWLSRARRYRDAALALETGRAIASSTAHALSPAPVEYDDVVTVNDDGAVVYLAAAKAGGYALVIAGGHDPQYVELPRFDRDSIRARVDEALPHAVGTRDAAVAAPVEPVPGAWDDTLRWLWRNGLHTIMLAHAHGRVVTLIPIGLLSLLPVHAAGVSQVQHVGMFSAVRYAPNVRTLDRCRAAAAACGTSSPALIVDVPDGYGLPPRAHLDHAAQETTAVAAIWARTGRAHLVAHDCRWTDFRDNAEGHGVWHIAGHGQPQSSGSALHFADAVIGIERLRGEIGQAPRLLAILSACDSNLTSASLPNETIGLPSALLQLGFAGVIATTWPIDDRAAPYLMAYFHQLWHPGETHPAVALHQAQRRLAGATRADLVVLLPAMGPVPSGDDHPFADPRYWAGFAYTGA